MNATNRDAAEQTSKIVVYGLEFQNALKACLAVSGNKEPFDVVQLRTADGILRVCARDGAADLIVAVDVNVEMLDVVADRDEVIEVSKSDARALSAMKVKKTEEEDEPMIGLIVRENSIVRTDESGLGLGIRQARVRRATWPGEDTALGDVTEMLETAASSEHAGVCSLTTHQIKRFGQVAGALNSSLQFQPLAASGEFASRTLVTSLDGMMLGFAATPHADNATGNGETDHTSNAPEGVDPLDGWEVTPAFDDRDNVRVLRATPPRGLA